MIRLHPRSQVVSKADNAFTTLMIEQEQKREQTYEELFALLADCLDALSAGMLREQDVARALIPRSKHLHDFRKDVAAIQASYELTYGEWFSILSRRIGEYAKSLIRHERHPNDPEKREDEA
jgi:hypothetical protein